MTENFKSNPRKSPFRVPDFNFKLISTDDALTENQTLDSNFESDSDTNKSNVPKADFDDRDVNLSKFDYSKKLDSEPIPSADDDLRNEFAGKDVKLLDNPFELIKDESISEDKNGQITDLDDIIAVASQPLAQSEADFFNLYPKMADSTNLKNLEQENDYSCGIGPFYPACLQRFANIKMFALHYALAVLSILMFHTSFIGSVTAIEKRFRFPSQKSGFLMSINDIGHVPFVIIASFYLGQSRKPFFLGLGTVLFSVGVGFMTLPYFIFGPQMTTSQAPFETIDSEGISLCRMSSETSSHKTTCSNVDFNRVSYILMCVGEIILGIGGSWIGPLGMSYIDDNVEKAKSVPLYMAAVSCVRSLGPVFGFLLSALCSSIHETLKNPGLDKRDPRWIGAWWLGFCIILILQIIIGIPLMLYPKKIRAKSNSVTDIECSEKMLKQKYEINSSPKTRRNDEIPKKLTNIISAVYSLIRNPVYIITTIGECISIYSIVGYMIFLPKYMESQFSISASYANAITGGLGVFSSSAGIILGGFIMKKLNIKLRGALIISIVGLLITAIKAILLMNLKCDPTNLAGQQNPVGIWNATQLCNRNCQCDMNHFEPVCGNGNQNLYLNPCLAGCKNYLTKGDNKIIAYTHCSCVEPIPSYIFNLTGSIGSIDLLTHPESAVPGLCHGKCRNFIPYLVIMALGSFLAAPAVVAITMVKLRCVSVEEKPFALGFSSFLMSILAFLPGPLITGTLIDKTCLIWKQGGDCDTSGSCLFYDNDRLRYVIHGILTLSKVLATLLYIIAWWFSKDRKYVELEKIHYKE